MSRRTVSISVRIISVASVAKHHVIGFKAKVLTNFPFHITKTGAAVDILLGFVELCGRRRK